MIMGGEHYLCANKYIQQGFTYLALLFFIAIMGIGLGSTGIIWHTSQKIEKEKELLFVGDQFRSAIKAYYHGVSGIHMYPTSLQDLLRDPRQIEFRRYLRKIYIDPMTGKTEWGLVKSSEGGIMGVYSLSSGQPIKQANFPRQYANFYGSRSYRTWMFVYSMSQEGQR